MPQVLEPNAVLLAPLTRPDERAARKASPDHHSGLGRYKVILRSRHVWLLAPTWIATAPVGLRSN